MKEVFTNPGTELHQAFLDALGAGAFVVLLDGLDEVVPGRVRDIEREIIQFRRARPNCPVIVSSRPDERFASWDEFTECRVAPMTREQALSLIDRLRYDESTKANFRDAVATSLFDSHRSFLENPLLLTLMLMTYDEFGQIPTKAHLFYSQAFDTLYYRHDASKEGGYRRELYCALPADDFRRLLSAFCFVSYLKRKSAFASDELDEMLTIAAQMSGTDVDVRTFREDMTQSLCLLFQDGLLYTFVHRSFQEYFAAVHFLELPQAQQESAFELILSGVGFDNVLPLAWEMQPTIVEGDFVIPWLSAVVHECEDGDPKQQALNCARSIFGSWTLGPEGLSSASVAEDGCDQPVQRYEMLRLIHDRFFDDLPRSWESEASERLYAALANDEERSAGKPIELQFEDASSSEVFRKVHFDDVRRDPAIASLIEDAFAGEWDYLNRALSALPILKERQESRQQSVDRFLESLGPGGRRESV